MDLTNSEHAFGRKSSGRRDVVERPFDRLSETWYIYVVGYIVLEDEMGDSKIDKEGTQELPFPNGKKPYLSRRK